MKKLKIVSVLLTAAMICSLFSGCMAVIAEVSFDASGKGSIKMSTGVSERMMSEEELQEAKADPEQVAFQYNGTTYYGTVESMNFNDIEAESAGDGSERYFRNTDGSWTIWINFSEDMTAEAGASEMDTAEMTQEMMDLLTKDMVALYTVHAPDSLIQIGGGKTGVTVNGKDLKFDMMAMGLITDHPAYGIYTFTTAKKLPTFSDVAANQWYTPAVTTLALGGVVDGVGGGRFAPAGKLTVAEFCQMVARAAGAEVGADESGYWAAKAVKACLNDGLIADRGEVNSENYGVVITREEAIAGMTLLMTGGLTDEDKTANAELSAQIPDYSQISAQYQELILAAYANGITSGVDANGTFRPMGELSRAEMCQLFYNVGIATVG